MKLLVATRSPHKLREIRRILADVPGLELVGPDDAGIAPDPVEETLEPFHTFEANAASKARYFQRLGGLPAVADDSGLAVDALDGAPGVRSKRFAPGDAEGLERDLANNAHLLRVLDGTPDAARTARYVCCVALVPETGADAVVFRGEAEGVILTEGRGEGGFGYDPLFFDPELGRTFAEIDAEAKNARSHRGKAFRALAQHLRGP